MDLMVHMEVQVQEVEQDKQDKQEVQMEVIQEKLVVLEDSAHTYQMLFLDQQHQVMEHQDQ